MVLHRNHVMKGEFKTIPTYTLPPLDFVGVTRRTRVTPSEAMQERYVSLKKPHKMGTRPIPEIHIAFWLLHSYASDAPSFLQLLSVRHLPDLSVFTHIKGGVAVA